MEYKIRQWVEKAPRTECCNKLIMVTVKGDEVSKVCVGCRKEVDVDIETRPM